MCRSWDHRAHHHDRRGSQRARLDPEPRPPVTTAPGVRVSDADREAVVAMLRRHTGDGRLTLEEFEERVDEVFRARTGDDLRTALRELPPLEHESRRGRGRHRRRPVAPGWLRPVTWLGAAVVGISILVGHLVLWPLFFAFFFFGGCGAKRHRHHREVERRDEPLTYV